MAEGDLKAPGYATDLACHSLAHGLYRKALPERLRDAYARFCQDPDALDLSAEISLLKTCLSDAVARAADAEAAFLLAAEEARKAGLGPPPRPELDVEALAKTVEAIGRAGDRQAARRWTMTPAGAEEVARRIVEAVAGALEGQPPEVVAKVRRALDAVRVPRGAFGPGMARPAGEGEAG